MTPFDVLQDIDSPIVFSCGVVFLHVLDFNSIRESPLHAVSRRGVIVIPGRCGIRAGETIGGDRSRGTPFPFVAHTQVL